jgi:hypothetical protein
MKSVINAILSGMNTTCDHGHGTTFTKHAFILMEKWIVDNAEQDSHRPYSPQVAHLDLWSVVRVHNPLQEEQWNDADALINHLATLFAEITLEKLHLLSQIVDQTRLSGPV